MNVKPKRRKFYLYPQNRHLDAYTKRAALTVSRSVISLESYSGEEMIFQCPGTIIDSVNSYSIILTTASLLRCSTDRNSLADNIKIASNKEATIAQYRDNNYFWAPIFRRNFQDWDINDILSLLETLESTTLVVEDQDRILWGNSKEKAYTVKECYKNMSSQNGILQFWPWKHVWKTRQPLRVSCFTWTALKKACLTQDNLRKKGVILINRCVMCKQTNESVNHLFLHCPAAASLWHFFYSTFGLQWVMPYTIKDAYASWILWRVDKSIKKIWRMIPAVIFWCLWKERNNRCFEGISTSVCALKAKCLVSLFSWHFFATANCVDNFLDFVSSLSLVQ